MTPLEIYLLVVGSCLAWGMGAGATIALTNAWDGESDDAFIASVIIAFVWPLVLPTVLGFKLASRGRGLPPAKVVRK